MTNPNHEAVEWDAQKVASSFEVMEEIAVSVHNRYADLLEEYNGSRPTFLENQTVAGDWLYRFIEAVISGYELAKLNSVTRPVNWIPTFSTTMSFLKTKHDKYWHDHMYYMVCAHLEGSKCSVKWQLNNNSECDTKPSLNRYMKKRLIERNSKNKLVTFVGTKFQASGDQLQSLQAILKFSHWSNRVLWTDLKYCHEADYGFREFHFKSRQLGATKSSTIEALCLKLLPLYIPIELLEGRSYIEDQVSAIDRVRTPILFSSNGLHGNSYFKHLVNLWRRDGAKLFYHQHGGGYGLLKRLAQEDYERSVADHFFTWGWKDNNGSNSVLRVGVNRVKNVKKSESTLLVCLDLPKLPYQIMYAPMPNRVETIATQTVAFLKKFNRSLIIRPYPSDYGNEMETRMRLASPNAAIQTPTSAGVAYKQHSLIVCNSLGTGWLEAIGNGIPTICFYDEDIYKFREEAEIIINNLRKVGVLHSCGESAAGFANGLRGNAIDWWRTSEVQAAICDLFNNVAGFDDSWLNTWEEAICGQL